MLTCCRAWEPLHSRALLKRGQGHTLHLPFVLSTWDPFFWRFLEISGLWNTFWVMFLGSVSVILAWPTSSFGFFPNILTEKPKWNFLANPMGVPLLVRKGRCIHYLKINKNWVPSQDLIAGTSHPLPLAILTQVMVLSLLEASTQNQILKLFCTFIIHLFLLSVTIQLKCQVQILLLMLAMLTFLF